jgi:G3E family GTPase
MQSVSAKIEGEVDPEKFMPWISELTQTRGVDILRSKGILAFKNEPKRFVFQGVHMILDGDLQRPWQDGESRQSKIIFIGRHLDEKAIREGFLACAA